MSLGRTRREMRRMGSYSEGTVLTCTHEDCDCRVLIQAACHCEGADQSKFRCGCGAELVPVGPN